MLHGASTFSLLPPKMYPAKSLKPDPEAGDESDGMETSAVVNLSYRLISYSAVFLSTVYFGVSKLGVCMGFKAILMIC